MVSVLRLCRWQAGGDGDANNNATCDWLLDGPAPHCVPPCGTALIELCALT